MLATHNNEKKRSIKPKQRRRKKAQKSGASIGVVEKMVFHHSENKDGMGFWVGWGKMVGIWGLYSSAWPVHRERGLRSGTSFLRRCLNLGLDTCMVYYHISQLIGQGNKYRRLSVIDILMQRGASPGKYTI